MNFRHDAPEDGALADRCLTHRAARVRGRQRPRRQLPAHRADARRHRDRLRRGPRPGAGSAASSCEPRQPAPATPGQYPSVTPVPATRAAAGRAIPLVIDVTNFKPENRLSGLAREPASWWSVGRGPRRPRSNTGRPSRIRPFGRDRGPSCRSSPARTRRRTKSIMSRAASKRNYRLSVGNESGAPGRISEFAEGRGPDPLTKGNVAAGYAEPDLLQQIAGPPFLTRVSSRFTSEPKCVAKGDHHARPPRSGSMITVAIAAAALGAPPPFPHPSTRGRSGQAPAARPACIEGKPNFGGIWQANNEANWDLQCACRASRRGHPAGHLSVCRLCARVPRLRRFWRSARRRARCPDRSASCRDDGQILTRPRRCRPRKQNAEHWIDLRSGAEKSLFAQGHPARHVHALSVPDHAKHATEGPHRLRILRNSARAIHLLSKVEGPPDDTWMGHSVGRWDRRLRWSST